MTKTDTTTGTDVAVLNEAELAELAILAGADPEADGGGPRTPVLKVNPDDEDADGNEIPRGQLFITEQDEPVYAKTVRIRPLTQHYQYMDFDGDAKKLRSKTVLNTSFKQEFIDSAGTIRCGRPGGVEWKEMSEERKKQFKDVSCTRLLGVLVSYEGKTKDGTKVTVENQPALFKLRGTNFMGFDDEVIKQIPKGRKMWDFWADITLTRQKNGATTYWTFNYKVDTSAPAPLDGQTVETIKHFASMVESENRQVRKDYEAAVRKRSGDAEAIDALGEDLDDDLNDDE